MKNKIFTVVIAVVFILFYACNEDEPDLYEGSVPTTFKVDIPSSLSYPGNGSKKAGIDPSLVISGDKLYENLRSFIYLGEESAQMIEDIMQIIYDFELAQELTLEYTSEDDGKIKEITVVKGAAFESVKYSFKCTIKDNESGNTAMQIFWKTNPVRGVAILSPYYIDKNTDAVYKNTLYRVDYNENESGDYTRQMTVYITGHPLLNDIFGIDNLKMFAGRSDDIITIYGNSNHPEAYFTEDKKQVGFNWAFVAKTNDALNVASAKIALTPTSYASTDSIFEKFDMQAVLFEEFYGYFYSSDTIYSTDSIADAAMQNTLNGILQKSESPGYFDQNGFSGYGEIVPVLEDYSSVRKLEDLTPYVPNEISNLVVKFDE